MTKKLLVFIILVFTSAAVTVSAYGETVFVYVKKGNFTINNSVKDNSAEWINFLENGITDCIFEGGHIVFSDNSGKNPDLDQKIVERIARSGGASMLVSVVLDITVSKNSLSGFGTYNVYNLSNGSILYSGEYNFDDSEEKESSGSVDEKLFAAGQDIGNKIIKAAL